LTKQSTIQKILASLLLVLFTISFLPKSYFHDVIANHTDAASCGRSSEKLSCIHEKGFHCSFNDLVAAAPYVPFNAAFNLVQPFIHAAYTGCHCTIILQQQFFGTESRGPPALVA
jgi:hypothetical protein